MSKYLIFVVFAVALLNGCGVQPSTRYGFSPEPLGADGRLTIGTVQAPSTVHVVATEEHASCSTRYLGEGWRRFEGQARGDSEAHVEFAFDRGLNPARTKVYLRTVGFEGWGNRCSVQRFSLAGDTATVRFSCDDIHGGQIVFTGCEGE